MAAPPVISAEDLTYAIGNRNIVSGVSFSLSKGDVFTILSSSGGGKTTLMRLCAGLLEPVSGRILIEGRDVREFRSTHRFRTSVRYLFEQGVLLSNATIYENVALPLTYHTRMDEEEMRRRVMTELAKMQIDRYKDDRPSSINRSVKKRAHFAMTLVMEPEILIIDNPLEDFDPEGAQIVLKRLKEMNEEKQVTMLIASHTLDLLASITNRIGIMEGGRMVQSGALEKIVSMLRSVDDQKLGFIENSNVI